MSNPLMTFFRDDSGATSIEYGLLAAGIALAISASLSLVSCSLTNMFNGIADAVPSP